MIPPGGRIEKNPKVVHHELDKGEGGVLLHLESGAYYGLNSTGALIWKLIDGTRTFPELLAEFRSQLEDIPAGVEEELLAFLTNLQNRGLIQTAA